MLDLGPDGTDEAISGGGGSLVVGTEADIVLIDPRTSWIVTGRDFNSLSRITPFEGQPVEGRAVRTIVGGADIFIR